MTLVYPGSFDPVTTGHINIARRAKNLADRLVVAVLDNPNKQTLFTVRERISFLEEAFDGDGIEVTAFSGLLVEFVRQQQADAIVRGLRSAKDFENENAYAANNYALSHAFFKIIQGREQNALTYTETIFIPASPALSYVSSSIIREAAVHIYKNKSDDSFIAEHVPPSARAALRNKFER
ncbi:MAG: pantetheine-phosphate adenylyltransferase [Defluviitaleaceae bacterium]|nr:pantetheine-phosphate adenylyltransferase [Defluviitaleaceae bacterium]